MKIRSLLLILALLVVPEALPAQHSRGHDSEHDGPVETLLRRREQLKLSAAQVARLEEIGRGMEERNAPLMARLLEMRRRIHADFPGSRKDLESDAREEYERRVDDARPLLREIRANNRAAMKEVGGVLSEEQKKTLRRILRRDDGKKRRDDDDRGKERDDGRGRGGGR